MQVLVNYETTWYNSNAEALKEIADGKLGTVRKVLVRDGALTLPGVDEKLAAHATAAARIQGLGG